MFKDAGLSLSGPYSAGFAKAKKYDLRENKPHVDELGRRLYDGDASVTEELIQCHMRVAAGIAKGIAHRYHQDLEDMVGCAYLGLVRGCDRLHKQLATPNPTSGYLITSAKSVCLNNCIDETTGFSSYEMAMRKELGMDPLRRDKLCVTIPAKANTDHEMTEFLESFLPTLSDQELDVLLYYLKGYTSAEICEELRRSPSTLSAIRNSLSERFAEWTQTWKK